MPSSFEFHTVTDDELADQLSRRARRERISVGSELVEAFLARGDHASRIEFATGRERNAAAVSASNYIKRIGKQIWIRKSSATALTIIDIEKSSADVQKAFETTRRSPRRKSA
jgi:hypothetical protein